MQPALQQLNSIIDPIRRNARTVAARASRWLYPILSAMRVGLARVWIALAPVRAGVVRLTTTGERPNRRLRRASFWLLAGGVCGLTAIMTATLGGFIILGADPLRNFSAPVPAATAGQSALSPEVQALSRQISLRRIALEGLQARGEALNRPQAELAVLRDALTSLAQLSERQLTLARERTSPQRRAAETAALTAEMDSATIRAIQRFAASLAQGLRKQIQADAALAAQLREAGWLGDLNSTIRTLRLADAPLGQIESQLSAAQTPADAAAIANRITDIGAAIARFRAPIPQAEDALKARTDFAALANEVRALVSQLREQANDRPWIFASSERKESWRQTVMRLEMLLPLLNELDALESQALQSTRPESIRAALLRATQIKRSVETGLTSALPSFSAPAGPSTALLEARQRTQRLAGGAEDAYRDAFERTSGRFVAPPRRRRDRDRLEELRDAMKRLYDQTVRISAADRAAQSTDNEAAVLQSANEAAALSQAHAQTLAQVNRLDRDLGR